MVRCCALWAVATVLVCRGCLVGRAADLKGMAFDGEGVPWDAAEFPGTVGIPEARRFTFRFRGYSEFPCATVSKTMQVVSCCGNGTDPISRPITLPNSTGSRLSVRAQSGTPYVVLLRAMVLDPRGEGDVLVWRVGDALAVHRGILN